MENYYENTKIENQHILNDLILNAPNAEAADTLKCYDIANTADANLKKINQERNKSNLESTANYLKIDYNNVKKSKLAFMIIEKVVTLLLEPCRLCKQYYSVKLNDEPLFKCYFCGQGCHGKC